MENYKSQKVAPAGKEQKEGPAKPKPTEVNQKALEERNSLANLLIQGADTLAKEALRRKKEREEEKFELRSGRKLSLKQINDVVVANRQPYVPMFPNSNPFFTEMYRLLGWDDKDPNKYVKPAIVGGYINQILYDRFHKDVQPALHLLAVPGGIRRSKFFQFLSEEGQKKLEEFRDEAIAVMKECTDWYQFRLLHGAKYGLSVQVRMFEEFSSSSDK